MSNAELLTVGQVVQRLKEIAPDLTVSKLRFYERQGLIQPARTQGGHRIYCPRTVERLRLILLLRKRANLPLQAVATLLNAFEKDPASVFLLHEWLQSPLMYEPYSESLNENDARIASGLSNETFEKIKTLRLVQPCPKTGKYDPEAVITLKAIGDLLDMGLTLEDLIPYRDHIDAVLEREETLFRKILKIEKNAHSLQIYQRFREALSRFRRFLFLNHLRRVLEKTFSNFENHKNHKEVEP